MNLSGRNRLYRRLPGVLGGILAVMAVAIAGVSPIEGAGQAPGQQEVVPQQERPTFKLQVERNLVPVRVVVRDRQGRAVGGLRKEDFRLFDNRKPQVITQFSVETPATPPTAGAEPAPPETVPTSAAPPGPSAIPQWRYLALFFDDLHLRFEDLAHARDAADQFLTTGLTPSDRVGIFTSSGLVTLDFTHDRAKLHEALFKLRPNPSAWGRYIVFFAGMYELVRRMATLPGQRTLVLISTGFLGWSCWMDRIADRAFRSSVVINTLDPAGLPILMREVDASWGPRTRADAGGRAVAEMHMWDSSMEFRKSFVLAELAKITGGVFFHHDNDLVAGFAGLWDLPEFYYTLAFSPQNIKHDGSFHRLKVKLLNRKGLSVVARRGYFAPTKLPAAEAQANEEFAEAVFADTELKELPVDVRAEVVSRERGHGLLWVLVHLDLRSLRFRKEEDSNANELTFATALFDREGKYVTGKRRRVPLRLGDAELEKLLASGMDLKTTFVVKPGTYRIRQVVGDSEDGRLAALNSMVEIPF